MEPFLLAHLVTTGLGPLFDGIGHLAVTPEDLLPVVALALLAGLGGKPYARTVLFTVVGAWLVGGILGLALGWAAPLAATGLSFLVLGGLVAVDRPLNVTVGVVLALGLGLVHGQMNGAEMGTAGLGVVGLLWSGGVPVRPGLAGGQPRREPRAAVDPDRRPGGGFLDRRDRLAVDWVDVPRRGLRAGCWQNSRRGCRRDGRGHFPAVLPPSYCEHRGAVGYTASDRAKFLPVSC